MESGPVSVNSGQTGVGAMIGGGFIALTALLLSGIVAWGVSQSVAVAAISLVEAGTLPLVAAFSCIAMLIAKLVL